jgi:hypothetical protein
LLARFYNKLGQYKKASKQEKVNGIHAYLVVRMTTQFQNLIYFLVNRRNVVRLALVDIAHLSFKKT